MSTLKRFIAGHSLSTYFGLTFAISWDGFVAVLIGFD